MEKTPEQIVHEAPSALHINLNNIEDVIRKLFDYETREELSYDVNDTLDAIMAEVYDARRTVKSLFDAANKTRLDKITGRDNRYPDRQ